MIQMLRVLLGFVAGVYADQTYKLPNVEQKLKQMHETMSKK
jgi:hypothetical protein